MKRKCKYDRFCLRKWPMVWLCLLLGVWLAGCVQPEVTPGLTEGQYYTYYVNSSGTALVNRVYEPQAQDTQGIVEELFLQCQTTPEGGEGRRAIPSNVVITKEPVVEDRIANLYFDTTYTTMDKLTELLCKAAMAKTITQLAEVDYIRIHVNDEVYTGHYFGPGPEAEAQLPGTSNEDEDEQVTGRGSSEYTGHSSGGSTVSTEKTLWSGADFLDNTGDDTNKYVQAEMTLYFAHPDGNALLTEVRQVVYPSTLSLVRAVLNQLIEGPQEDGMIATLPKNLKVTGVSLRDGVCYVDFDATFLEEPVQVTDQVEIYSIVNSLTKLDNVLQVQITINGSADAILRNNISLSKRFEKDFSLMYVPEEENTEAPTTEAPTTEAPTVEEIPSETSTESMEGVENPEETIQGDETLEDHISSEE